MSVSKQRERDEKEQEVGYLCTMTTVDSCREREKEECDWGEGGGTSGRDKRVEPLVMCCCCCCCCDGGKRE